MTLKLNPVTILIVMGIIIFSFPGCGPKMLIRHAPVEMGESVFGVAERSFQTGAYDKALEQYKTYLENPSAIMEIFKKI